MAKQKNFWSFFKKPKNNFSENALVAAATVVRASQATFNPQYSSWQEEAWAYYDSLGEFRFAIDWKAEMISRIRLRAAKKSSDADEPEILNEGIAAELVNEIGNDIGGQSAILSTLATQLGITGDGYLIGESTSTDGLNKWIAYSADEIRRRSGRFEIIDIDKSSNMKMEWRPLSENSLIVRVWRPHKRFHYMADAPTRSMRATMRELELVNRKIQAAYLSRLASAGSFIIPDEISYPVRKEFQDAPDPFVLEWIEIAKQAIETPGSAAAAVPIPIRVPSEYVDKFKFIDFTLASDEKVIEKRESAIRRLAAQVDIPAEILVGMGDTTHWNAWMIEEQAIKSHISSEIELIVNALTTGYLHPRLKALGEFTEDLVVWYDASEITARPDKSDRATEAYDRMEISSNTYRREIGFNESDAPTDEETREMALRKLSGFVTTGFVALAELLDDNELIKRAAQQGNAEQLPIGDVEYTPEDDTEINNGNGNDDSPNNPVNGDRSLPDTLNKPLPTPGTNTSAQAKAIHRIHFGFDEWSLHHPSCCEHALLSCPVAQASRFLTHFPGTTGDYECWLSAFGELIIGKQVFDNSESFIQGHKRKMARFKQHNQVSHGTRTRS